MNQYIDHTLLRPDATEKEMERLCFEALKYHFFSVCVNSSHVSFSAQQLRDSAIKIVSVIGFPLGASSSFAKLKETEQALKDGATEIDMVINITWVKDKKSSRIISEINAIKNLLGSSVLKVILEMCYLTEEEKKSACAWSIEAGCDFLKTSTGFGLGGATLADVTLMKRMATNTVQVKASGGIRNAIQAKQFIEAGVTRIGTSHGVAIVNGFDSQGSSY